jgi:acetoin utilization protein AcuB
MKVKDIMIKDVISVFPETKITEVAKILFKNRFHAVPVVEDKKIIGIVTENDFFTRDCENIFLPSHINFIKGTKFIDKLEGKEKEELERLINLEAKDIMARKCVSILESMDVKDLLEFFKETRFVTLPVINDKDELVGVVTVSDILGLIRVD